MFFSAKKRRGQNLEGFTLIELLMVIAIIGILATVILVKLAGGKEKAQWNNYAAYVSQVTKLVRAAAAGGYLLSLNPSPTSACLGIYGAVGTNASCNSVHGTVPAIDSALLNVGTVPRGQLSPLNRYGTWMTWYSNRMRINAYVGGGNVPNYCDKFGWERYTPNIPADPMASTSCWVDIYY